MRIIITVGLMHICFLAEANIWQNFDVVPDNHNRTCDRRDLLKSTEAISLLWCAFKCFIHEACTSFLFYPMTEICDECRINLPYVAQTDNAGTTGNSFYGELKTNSAIPSYQYEGCFEGIRSKLNYVEFSDNTIEKCALYCSSYEMFSLLSQNCECFSTSVFNYEDFLLLEDNCSWPCPGNPNQECGGNNGGSYFRLTTTD